MAGRDVFLRLRELNPRVRVIMASGFFISEIKSELQAAGVCAFMQNPYRIAGMLKLVREVIDTP